LEFEIFWLCHSALRSIGETAGIESAI